MVKAADGVTDIYGNMWKPFDFDSTKKYPIIAHVYPGPQTEQVNTTFNAGGVQQQLAQLGFIVIQIGNRGGSPLRSNAYQNFSYYNLRDYALADKKAGIEQLAARHKFIDIDRVGHLRALRRRVPDRGGADAPAVQRLLQGRRVVVRQPRQQHLQPELERAVSRPEDGRGKGATASRARRTANGRGPSDGDVG